MSRVEAVKAEYAERLAVFENTDARERGWCPTEPPAPWLHLPEPLVWLTGPCPSRVVFPNGQCGTCRNMVLEAVPNPKDNPPGLRQAPSHERRYGIYAIVDPEPDDEGGWYGQLIDAGDVPRTEP